MENHDELDDLMEEMKHSKESLKGIQHLVDDVFGESSVPRQTIRPVSKRMILELM